MTNLEQEVLFGRVKHRFIDRSVEWCNGYVAGVSAEDLRMSPDPQYLAEDTTYATGYVAGFLAARGADALFAPWAFGLELAADDIRWWEDAD